METVTREAIIAGKKYKPRPGLGYEIAPGIVAKMKEDTVDLVRVVNAIEREEGGKEKPFFEIALEQARLILEVPEQFSDWGKASSKVVWRVCQDFLLLTLPTERPPDES